MHRRRSMILALVANLAVSLGASTTSSDAAPPSVRALNPVTWQDRTYLADLPAAYQAPNRAHNLRAYFASRGIRVIPRIEATSASA